MADERDNISFESTEQTRLRRLHGGARTNGSSQLAGYLTPDGQKIAWTGDEAAPYVKIINESTSPVIAQVSGDVAAHATDSGNPVKIGGYAVSSIIGTTTLIDAGDRVNLVADLAGRLIVALGGGDSWTQYNDVLATPELTFLVANVPAMIGRIGITLDEATAMYALVYDGTDVGGTLIDRFYIPASGTSVRDYTTEGGLYVTSGCFVALTTDPGAVASPVTGGFCHAIYQAV